MINEDGSDYDGKNKSVNMVSDLLARTANAGYGGEIDDLMRKGYNEVSVNIGDTADQSRVSWGASDKNGNGSRIITDTSSNVSVNGVNEESLEALAINLNEASELQGSRASSQEINSRGGFTNLVVDNNGNLTTDNSDVPIDAQRAAEIRANDVRENIGRPVTKPIAKPNVGNDSGRGSSNQGISDNRNFNCPPPPPPQ